MIKAKYQLQVWNKKTKKYITTWSGNNWERALIMAKKPYNNHPWMGKKRVLTITIHIHEVK